MKKHFFTISIVVGACLFANSQEITPQVIATAGNYAENGGYSVSWTIGEPVIATATNGGTTLTQGFQQPSYNIVSVTSGKINGFEVNVYPNPASDFIIIDWTTDSESTLEISLFDLAGKLISMQSYSASQDKVSINMSRLASAQYILEVKETAGSAAKIFQIFKK